jgi:predicted ArsR family transcriptional regulator
MSMTEDTRRESYGAAQRDATARRRVVLDILAECGPLTAREVAAELHRRGVTPTGERNFAAPRLTELKAAGYVEVSGKKLCADTGRSVAVWRVKKGA